MNFANRQHALRTACTMPRTFREISEGVVPASGQYRKSNHGIVKLQKRFTPADPKRGKYIQEQPLELRRDTDQRPGLAMNPSEVYPPQKQMPRRIHNAAGRFTATEI